MKVTALTTQQRDPNRVNVMIDGKYRFSLDIGQIADLKIKIGNEYDEAGLAELLSESEFGKLYAHALEYSLMRPHSSKEIRDYLYRKTFAKRYKSKKTGEIKEKPGVSSSVTTRVFNRLVEKGYVSDENFAHFWVENRHLRKGISMRKLKAELIAKGISSDIVDRQLGASERSDDDELKKIVMKKRGKYHDDQKLIQYLARQGFGYDDIKSALSDERVD